MASKIIVNEIGAPTTGANANKIIIPSGVTLMPSAGQIIKQEIKEITGQVAINNGTPTSLVSSGYFIDYTPLSSTSKIIVQVFYHLYKSSSSFGGGLQLRKDGTAMNDIGPINSANGNWTAYDASQANMAFVMFNTAVETSGNTNSRQYQCYGSNYTGTGVVTLNYVVDVNNARSFMKVTEMAQ